MIKYLIFLILAIFIILYFFISTQKQDSELKTNLKKVEDKKVEDKKINLIDNFINTKSNIPLDYKIKDNYDKPKNIENKKTNKVNDTNIDIDVDINKEIKELERIKFKFEKNF